MEKLRASLRRSYYFYCWVGGHLFLPLYLTSTLTMGDSLYNRATVIMMIVLVMISVTVMPIFRFPNFLELLGKPASVTLWSMGAATIGVTAGSWVIMETLWKGFLLIVPGEMGLKLSGPFLLVLVLICVIWQDVRLKKEIAMFQYILSRNSRSKGR